ncbi:MAG TPA: DNA mismatch repair endonuclease MutL, partial [Candidatus Coatesbacteria bacterium]|nr:DNA mismatch repair endonuclease MutL [Candidatus Coatesbacteria bacterium]
MPDGMIKVLPPFVAERIAAGEVIERPASVVKELVENSLDAKARRIEVELEAGGKSLVRVSDDGYGMTPEDARACFKRHATSKIDRFEDLELLRTYGFRGEALPSIGAVARVRLVTRFRDRERGTEVVFEGGRLLRHGEAGAPVGTDVVVRDLFYNVPARRKFLKTDTGERAACVDIVARMALARPETAFHLLAEGKTVLVLPPADGFRRVLDYFGPKAARGAEPVGYESPGVGALRGVIWHPNLLCRANRRGILVYVNGRPVENRMVT